jgi:hypothetical protein
MVKLQQGNNQYFVTVPSAIVRMKGWKKQKELIWKEDGRGNLLLKEDE